MALNIPNVIQPGDYIADLRSVAWSAAGWYAERDPATGDCMSWGPASIRRSVDLDVLEMSGCLDSRRA